MEFLRRDLLKLGIGLTGASLTAVANPRTALAAAESPHSVTIQSFDVKSFGATGDGQTIDTRSINKAIEAAEAAGGGMVRVPAGQYLCYSIRLRSNVALVLEQGAVIIAADALPPGVTGGYDEPEPNRPWEQYQDFGHSHWHNSLIWGEGLHDISILGPGRIWGRGLSRNNGPDVQDPVDSRMQGVGNKSIALKECHNVLLKDFQILKGGWFGILATGVDNLIIEGLTIDTDRDGMDIDSCRNVHITSCSVNSPRDDAIVFKSSFALGYERPCENLTLANCYVSGAYAEGSMLDGTWKKRVISGGGRIKCGTESNGGFKNIAIANCIFDGCRGLAIESVDGGLVEDIVITNLTMRNIVFGPLFIRLGARLRGPSGTKVGAIRRVSISNLISSDAGSKLCCIISGIPGFPVEDLKISNLYLQHKGGGTREEAALVPPENENKYPETGMFGPMPAQGFFLRHVKNIEVSDLEIVAEAPDERSNFVLCDVADADFFRVKTKEQPGVPKFVLNHVSNFGAARCRDMKDTEISQTNRKELL